MKDNRLEDIIAVIGLGYVGMPIAVAFARKISVIGFDINSEKIKQYKNGIDPTREVGNEAISQTAVDFTSDEARLKEASFHIVAVPTPINEDHTPNLNPVKSASRTLGRNLSKGSTVVYESTVYPGVTEDVCIPILEEESGLVAGEDFKVGYSPERINPGDHQHTLETITKVISAQDEQTLDKMASVYKLVVDAGVYKAESIKVAESAKVIENAQRDINIAFMNELSVIFNKLNIDTNAVLKAAGTKWNFLPFTPGLVGGHCIGVDPYYLTYKAEQLGYHSQIILAGRKINDGMGKHIAEKTVKKMIKAKKQISGSRVAIFGFTFKENTPDVRNTRVIDIVDEFKDYDIDADIVDPIAYVSDMKSEYDLTVKDINSISPVDAVIMAVPHEEFKAYSLKQLKEVYRKDQSEPILIDVKSMFNKQQALQYGFDYWRL